METTEQNDKMNREVYKSERLTGFVVVIERHIEDLLRTLFNVGS